MSESIALQISEYDNFSSLLTGFSSMSPKFVLQSLQQEIVYRPYLKGAELGSAISLLCRLYFLNNQSGRICSSLNNFEPRGAPQMKQSLPITIRL